MDNRIAHPTKKGPGRKHGHKVKHGAAPKPAKGFFLGQHKNPQRNKQRAAVAAVGRRQYLKAAKLARREVIDFPF